MSQKRIQQIEQRIDRICRRHGHHRALNRDRAGHVLAQVLGGEMLERWGRQRQLFGRQEG